MRLSALAALVSSVAILGCSADESVVNTTTGVVQGLIGSNYRLFLGIPYAAPPINDLRWQPPQPASSWAGVYNATVDPPGCIQQCGEPPHVCPVTTSEDCLFLSVWTPRLANITRPRPVIIFIHGGNFRDGGGAGVQGGLVYDSQNFAGNTGTVVVQINYRLGALGFLYAGNETSIAGNYGLRDQELAFRWVQDNIAAFGGDPARVTIMGQSAGAMSVASHLIRPSEKGLFHRAIMLSEPFTLPFRTVSSGMLLARRVAFHANCSDENATVPWPQVEACLRGLPANVLLAAQMSTMTDPDADIEQIIQIFMPFPPTVGTEDGYLPVTPLQGFHSADLLADVPIVLGTTSNETTIFIFEAFGKPVSTLEYQVLLAALIGLDAVIPVNEAYPVPSPAPNDTRPLLATVATDLIFACATRNATEGAQLLVDSHKRKSPLFLYSYSHLMSFAPTMWGPNFTECWDSVCHGTDLVPTFHPNFPALGTNYTAAEDTLSAAMEAYYANFAASGDPNFGGGFDERGLPVPAHWFTYSLGYKDSMNFDIPVTPQRNYKRDLCDLWDRLGYTPY